MERVRVDLFEGAITQDIHDHPERLVKYVELVSAYEAAFSSGAMGAAWALPLVGDNGVLNSVFQAGLTVMSIPFPEIGAAGSLLIDWAGKYSGIPQLDSVVKTQLQNDPALANRVANAVATRVREAEKLRDNTGTAFPLIDPIIDGAQKYVELVNDQLKESGIPLPSGDFEALYDKTSPSRRRQIEQEVRGAKEEAQRVPEPERKRVFTEKAREKLHAKAQAAKADFQNHVGKPLEQAAESLTSRASGRTPEEQIAAIRSTCDDLRGTIGTLSAVIGLVDPELGRRMDQAGSGAIAAYGAIATMAAKSVTPLGLFAAAQGITSVIGAFGSGGPDPVVAQLQTVMKFLGVLNAKLDAIAQNLVVLDKKIDALMALMRWQGALIAGELRDLKEAINIVQTILLGNFEAERNEELHAHFAKGHAAETTKEEVEAALNALLSSWKTVSAPQLTGEGLGSTASAADLDRYIGRTRLVSADTGELMGVSLQRIFGVLAETLRRVPPETFGDAGPAQLRSFFKNPDRDLAEGSHAFDVGLWASVLNYVLDIWSLRTDVRPRPVGDLEDPVSIPTKLAFWARLGTWVGDTIQAARRDGVLDWALDEYRTAAGRLVRFCIAALESYLAKPTEEQDRKVLPRFALGDDLPKLIDGVPNPAFDLPMGAFFGLALDHGWRLRPFDLNRYGRENKDSGISPRPEYEDLIWLAVALGVSNVETRTEWAEPAHDRGAVIHWSEPAEPGPRLTIERHTVANLRSYQILDRRWGVPRAESTEQLFSAPPQWFHKHARTGFQCYYINKEGLLALDDDIAYRVLVDLFAPLQERYKKVRTRESRTRGTAVGSWGRFRGSNDTIYSERCF